MIFILQEIRHYSSHHGWVWHPVVDNCINTDCNRVSRKNLKSKEYFSNNQTISFSSFISIPPPPPCHPSSSSILLLIIMTTTKSNIILSLVRLILPAGHYQAPLLSTHQELIWLITPHPIHPPSRTIHLSSIWLIFPCPIHSPIWWPLKQNLTKNRFQKKFSWGPPFNLILELLILLLADIKSGSGGLQLIFI